MIFASKSSGKKAEVARTRKSVLRDLHEHIDGRRVVASRTLAQPAGGRKRQRESVCPSSDGNLNKRSSDVVMRSRLDPNISLRQSVPA